MSKHTRTEILDTAKKYVTKDRAATHGDMESNLTTINPMNVDNWEDSCGYMACGGELIAETWPEPPHAVKFQGGNT